MGAGVALKTTDLPDDFPEKARLYPDPSEWVNKGDSVVIRPGGKVAVGPLRAEQGILYADLEPAEAGAARRTLDVAGHYARADVFQLRVDRRPLKAVEFVSPRE